MDADLEGMSRDQLVVEVKRLRHGIHPALWSLLPEQSDHLPVIPDWPEFLRGCVRYRQSLDEQLPKRPEAINRIPNEHCTEWSYKFLTVSQANFKESRRGQFCMAAYTMAKSRWFKHSHR